MRKISQGFFQVIFQILPVALYQRLGQSFFYRSFTSIFIYGHRAGRNASFFFSQLFSKNLSSKLNKIFARTLATIQYHILNNLKLFCRNISVSNFGRRIYNSEIHSLFYGVIEEYRVHCLANVVVSAERETKVTNTSAHVSSRQVFPYPGRSADKIEGIGIVLLHTCCNSQYVGVEDYVVGIHAHTFCKNLVGTLCYLYSAFVGSCLTNLVEAHNHYCSTISFYVFSVSNEFLLALFQRYRVYNALTLNTLQASLYYLPVTRVDHHWNLGYIRLCGNHV